ncbi:hypothetical protein [Endozoicomonas sp. 8E]|uniref:hypothetical protein n=1 Tax=Endozoicomonas sp. 8E TaxID=3035692 RepID=UPI002938E9B8|nr:hypothetical protein [Endozoicomonas sp. 8E]WOG25598.1 hypothetical protein P6910_13490 [Endozoicomonas sp. 8E]
MSQKPNNSFPSSDVVIPAKAGIQRQRRISAFSGMTRPGGTGQCGSGGESVWIPAFAGMTTSDDGDELLEFCDTHRAWEPEFCDSLDKVGSVKFDGR